MTFLEILSQLNFETKHEQLNRIMVVRFAANMCFCTRMRIG